MSDEPVRNETAMRALTHPNATITHRKTRPNRECGMAKNAASGGSANSAPVVKKRP